MAKSIVRIMCWRRSHVTELLMNKAQEQRLEADIPKMKKVCPGCKPDNCAITIVNGTTIFAPSKAYRCEHGHLNLVAPLGDGLNVCFGPGNGDFANISGSLEELSNLIDDGKVVCHHVVDGQSCGCRLTAIDDYILTYPSLPVFKIKMRVGDLWDRHGVEPVRNGSYDGNGKYNESRSQKANKNRLSRMPRQRNTSQDRQPGMAINRATKNDYGHRNKSSVNPDKLE